MRYLQMPYIAVLNLFYNLVKHMNERLRKTGMILCCYCLAAYFPLNYSKLLPDWLHTENQRMLLICILFFLIAVFGMKDRVQPVRWRWPLVIVYYAFAVLILAARCHHGLAIGYTMFSLFLLILLPAYMLVWSSRGDVRELFGMLSQALVVVGIVFFVASVIVWPYAPEFYLEGRYTGLTTHPNLLAMVYLVVMVAAIYRMISVKKAVPAAVSMGCSVSALLLTESRTALLAAALVIIASIVYILKNRKELALRAGWMILLVVILCASARAADAFARLPIQRFSFYGIECIQKKTDNRAWKYLPEALDAAIAETGEAWPTEPGQIKAGVPEIANAEMGAMGPAEPGQAVSEPLFTGRTAMANTSLLQRPKRTGTGLNAFSSGRMDIYRWVVAHSGMWGTDADENPIVINDMKFAGAHNTPLEFIYHCGWPAGIAIFLLEAFSVVVSCCLLFGRRTGRADVLFAGGMVLAFFVESMLEIQTLPSFRDVTCYFYLVLPVLFLRPGRDALLRSEKQVESSILDERSEEEAQEPGIAKMMRMC